MTRREEMLRLMAASIQGHRANGETGWDEGTEDIAEYARDDAEATLRELDAATAGDTQPTTIPVPVEVVREVREADARLRDALRGDHTNRDLAAGMLIAALAKLPEVPND